MKFSILCFICKQKKVLASKAWVGSEDCHTIQQTVVEVLVELSLFSHC